MTATRQTGGRYALIVAVSHYRDEKLRKLRAPAADAERLSAVLRDPDIGGFNVDVATDEEEPQLRRRIARFFSNRRPDDLLLVHFSCHGVKDENGELYLAAKDTEVGELLGATGISSTWLSGQIGRCRSKRVVVLLDCCFSGSFPFGMRARAGEDVNVKDHLEGRGRAVITATSAMEYAYEGDELSGHGEPSIFTDAVVEGLRTGKADRDGDKWISVDELYNYVFDRVKDKTPNQNPNNLSTLEGPLHIARSVYERPIEPAKLNDELLALTKHQIASARLGAVQELAKLCDDDDRAVALAARQKLEQMINDDSFSVRQAVQAALRTFDSRSVAERPVWSRNPRLAGDPRVGQQLSLTDLSVPAGQVALTYRWQRELSDRTRLLTIQDAHDDHYEPGPEDLGCRVRASITARGTFGEAVADTDWSAPVTAQSVVPPPRTPWGELTEVRAAGAVAVSGAIVVIASFLGHNHHKQTLVFYRVPVALMSVAVILLIGFALRSNRIAPLLAGTGLALALLGVTFPMSWPPGNLPKTVGFWVGACGAAVAAAGAAFASWLAYPEAPKASDEAPRPTRSRTTRAALAMPGPLIVIASLFVLPEWTNMGGTTWHNWNHPIYRYPSTIVVLCGLMIALAARGIRDNRKRLLVIAAAVACLVLGEAVPLIFPGVSDWGAGRWVRIVGAVFAVAGLAVAAATTRRDAAASLGDG